MRDFPTRLPAEADEREQFTAYGRKLSEATIYDGRIFNSQTEALREIFNWPMPPALEQARGHLADKDFVISRQRCIQAVQPIIRCDHVVLGPMDCRPWAFVIHRSPLSACVPFFAVHLRRRLHGWGGPAGPGR